MAKAKNERFVLKDDVFQTGDHVLFKFHKEKDCFHARRVLSLNDSVKGSFRKGFSVLSVERDERRKPLLVLGCVFKDGVLKSSFFHVLSRKKVPDEVLSKYGLTLEDFKSGEDDLAVMEKVEGYLKDSKFVLFAHSQNELEVLKDYQPELDLSYLDFPSLASRVFMDHRPHSFGELEQHFRIVRDPLVLETDCVSMGKILLCLMENKKKENAVEEKEVFKQEMPGEGKAVPVMEPEPEIEPKQAEEKNEEEKTSFASVSKGVDVYDRDGNYLKSFASNGQASRETGVGNKEIRIACNSELMKKLNKGYRFAWSKEKDS